MGTTSKGKRPLRALSASDKIDAIQRVNDGESKASVARDIGVPESTLRGWCKNEDKLRYMSSRHSTPDTDKSSDGITDGLNLSNSIPEKRAKYDIPSSLGYSHNGSVGSSQYPETRTDLLVPTTEASNGLDLSRVKKDESELKSSDTHVDFASYTRSTLDLSKNMSDLSKYNTDLVNSSLAKESKHKMESGANMSMSAISPLSGLNHLSGLSSLGQSHLGLSFNEIATNLSLIAQLNPSLSALTNSINTSAKALRSIRSPKPSHNSSSSGLNVTEKHKSSKSHHHSDLYGEKTRSSRSSHNSYKDTGMDDSLWYWFKKQQAMLNMTNNTSTSNPLSMPHSLPTSRSNKEQYSTHTSKPITSLPSVAPQLDTLNKNSWFWQYYKQFTGNLGLPEDKLPQTDVSALPKTDAYENILYSHLTKEKSENLTPQEQCIFEKTAKAEIKQEQSLLVESCPTPPGKDKESNKSNTKARAVLDNLLFNNNNNDIPLKPSPEIEEGEKDSNAENEFGCEVNEALEHGEKFLKWLEACQEPSVTRMQVHQLKGLLNNIKANAEKRGQIGSTKDRVSRRK